MESLSPLRAGLAYWHASPLAWVENFGGSGPMGAALGHGLTFPSPAQGCLLGYPSARGMAGAGSLEHLATARGQHLHLLATNGRQSFWTDSTRLCLQPLGDVTVVLSKQACNVDLKHTKILGTNLVELTARQVVLVYQKGGPWS